MKLMIIEISTYLIVAISLGYLFGWIITRLMLKGSFEKQVKAFKQKYRYAAEGIDELQQELILFKSKNSDLHSINNKVLLENSGRKLQLNEIQIKYKELKKLNVYQSSAIKKLNLQLLDKENELLHLKQEHEAKIKPLLHVQEIKN